MRAARKMKRMRDFPTNSLTPPWKLWHPDPSGHGIRERVRYGNTILHFDYNGVAHNPHHARHERKFYNLSPRQHRRLERRLRRES